MLKTCTLFLNYVFREYFDKKPDSNSRENIHIFTCTIKFADINLLFSIFSLFLYNFFLSVMAFVTIHFEIRLYVLHV